MVGLVTVFLLLAGALFTAGASAAEPPVAGWSFDEGAGETVADFFGEDAGTVEGPEWVEGKFGAALRFHGEDSSPQCVTVPNSEDLQLGGKFTIEAWVRPEGGLSGDPILDKENGSHSSYMLGIGIDSSNKLEGEIVGGTEEKAQRVLASETLAQDTWTHVAFTFDGSKERLYIGGELAASHAATLPPVPSSGPLVIGCAEGAGEMFWGKIDEVRIYQRALPESEIQTDAATAIQTPPSTEPVAAWSLDEGGGEVAGDLYGGHTATVEGPEWVEGKFGSALRFDGEEDCVSVPDSWDLRLEEDFTLEAWVRPEGEIQEDPVIVKEEEGGEFTYGVGLGFVHDGRVEGYVGEEATGHEQVLSPQPVPLDAWSHIAMTYDGEHLRLYVDGELVDSDLTSEGAGMSAGGSLSIGCFRHFGEDFKGKIDEVRVYDRALTTGQIETDEVSAIQTPPSTEPAAGYTFDEDEGTTVTDTASGHEGAVEGATWTEGKWGSGLHFGPGEDCVSVPDAWDLRLEEAFTFEAWVKPEGALVQDPIIFKESSEGEGFGSVLGIGLTSTGKPQGYTEGQHVTGSEPLTEGVWTHFAYTYDGERMRLYEDGELVSSKVVGPETERSDGPLLIGCSKDFGENFRGTIDEPRVYPRALTPGQIEADEHNDFTPPKVELTGALTEGLKEGTTEYPLHVKATDGEPGSPGVGVKSITISVDGAVVDTVEQECEAGNCPLEVDWTYDSEASAGDEHLVTVQTTDQAGNTSSVPLRVVPANGSVPGCDPSDPAATNSTPETTEPTAGGGQVETYQTREGTTISLTVPPAGFNPATASDTELAEYGFPARPSNPAEAEEWNEKYDGAQSSRPDICNGLVRSDAKKPEGGGAPTVETTPSGIWSGYEAFNAENKNVWTAIKGLVTLPTPKAPQCTGGSLLAEWVGLGGDEEREPYEPQGFIQAGVEEDSAETLSTWIEYYPRNGEGTSVTLGIPVAQNDLVEQEVAYNPDTEMARIVLYDVTTHEYFPPTTIPLSKASYYSGSSAEFVDERPTYGEVNRAAELRNFGSINWTHAEVRSKEGWRPIGKEPLRRNVMRSGKTVLAEPGPIGSDNRSYVDRWKNCHG